MMKRENKAGFTLIELLVLLAVIALLAGILVPNFVRAKAKADRIKCVSRLKIIGLSFRIFATDNNDLFPPAVMMSNGVELASIDVTSVYRVLSNELSTPALLVCRSDKGRKIANSFASLTPQNISYFASLTANETLPQSFVAGDRNLRTNGVTLNPGLFPLTTNSAISWSKEMHVDQGEIGMGDGSVQQMSTSRLKQSVADQGIETNYLAVP